MVGDAPHIPRCNSRHHHLREAHGQHLHSWGDHGGSCSGDSRVGAGGGKRTMFAEATTMRPTPSSPSYIPFHMLFLPTCPSHMPPITCPSTLLFPGYGAWWEVLAALWCVCVDRRRAMVWEVYARAVRSVLCKSVQSVPPLPPMPRTAWTSPASCFATSQGPSALGEVVW